MKKRRTTAGFTLIEIVVALGIFILFALGIYSSIVMTFRVGYQARLKTLETALLNEEFETARNLPYASVGTVGGVPSGVLAEVKNVARDGSVFTVTTTVRNIDDPYDGTLGGNPDDAAPADYKLVEMTAICASCGQRASLTLSTRVAPKNLESATKNGALLITVGDANGLPVAGANVHITNAKVSPPINTDDVTDNLGVLKIIDAPTSTQGYNITVTKEGYSSDYTSASTSLNPNPSKPPASVESQKTTSISFAIDRAGALLVRSVNSACAAIASADFNLRGQKLIGARPDAQKFNQNFSTNGSGQFNFSSQEWDSYLLTARGTAYDIAGTIPLTPLALLPGASQELSAVLASHSSNSLLVKVRDAGTGLPLSNATVRLEKGSYDKSLLTGLGFARQTDWSGGSGQTEMIDETRYFSDDGGVSVGAPAGDVTLRRFDNSYQASGWLESATYDLAANVNFNTISWNPIAQPAETGAEAVLAQIATSATEAPSQWNFLGPDGTATSYYSVTNTIISAAHNGDRYLRYRLYLGTLDTLFSPSVAEVAITYTTGCSAPGQSFFNALSAGTYTLTISHEGYAENSGSAEVDGNDEVTVNLSPL